MAVIEVQANEPDPTKRTVEFFLIGTDGISAVGGETGQPVISTDGGKTWSTSGIGAMDPSSRTGYGRAVLDQATVATAGTVIRTSYKSGNTLECPGDTAVVVAADAPAVTFD